MVLWSLIIIIIINGARCECGVTLRPRLKRSVSGAFRHYDASRLWTCDYNASHPRTFDEKWVLDPNLVAKSQIVATLGPEISTSRYMTVAGDTLYAKVGASASATPYDRIVEFSGCDEWLRRSREPCVSAARARTSMDDINPARNAAVIRTEDGEWLLGGEHSLNCGDPGDPCGKGATLFKRNGSGWDLLADRIITGNHPGCLEKRQIFRGQCEFDGRWSLTQFKSKFLVYGRANLAPRKGGRWATVATIDAQRRVSPFRKIEFAEDQTTTAGKAFASLAKRQASELNLYFVAVNPHPLDPKMLLALVPISTRDYAYLAIALSCDAVHFSPPHPLFDSQLAVRGPGQGRGLDHPIDGFRFDQNTLYLYTQINVRGIAPAKGDDATDVGRDPPPSPARFAAKDYPPHLVAHAIPFDNLAAYTRTAILSLKTAFPKSPTAQCAADARDDDVPLRTTTTTHRRRRKASLPKRKRTPP